jgi:uncharacterized protein YbjT (DUF2867 family)
MAIAGLVLITGATGRVGSALLDRLSDADVDLRVLSHDESKAQSLRNRGVEVIQGDFLTPETLGPALDQVTAVFLATPIHPEQITQATNVIEAARNSGTAPRIVRLSVHQASHQAPTRNSRQHAVIEDALASSGLPYTVLRPQSFMQNTLMAASTVATQGKIYQPMKDGRLGMIDARDIGAVAARVLTEEGHDGQIYTLTGPAAISFHDVARILSGILGREVSYLSVSLDKAKETMLARGLSEWLADTLTEYANAHSAGYSDWTTDDVERLTDHRATPYQQFAKDFAMVFLGDRPPTK